jgi:hypothetical protein
MNCDGVREFFSEFFDGESECAEEISAHLKNCVACAAEYEKFCELIEEVRALPQPQLPAFFSDDLAQGVRLHTARKKQTGRRALFGQFSIAAAASFLIFAVWFTGLSGINTRQNGDMIYLSDNDENFIAYDAREFRGVLSADEAVEPLESRVFQEIVSLPEVVFENDFEGLLIDLEGGVFSNDGVSWAEFGNAHDIVFEDTYALAVPIFEDDIFRAQYAREQVASVSVSDSGTVLFVPIILTVLIIAVATVGIIFLKKVRSRAV